MGTSAVGSYKGEFGERMDSCGPAVKIAAEVGHIVLEIGNKHFIGRIGTLWTMLEAKIECTAPPVILKRAR